MASTDCRIVIHAIFATKGRTPLIKEAWRTELWAYMGGTINGLGAKTIAVGGTADHAHVAAILGSTLAVEVLMRELKKSSSTWAKGHDRCFAWQRGYGAVSCRSEDIPSLIRYIDNQEEHHRHVTPYEEYLAFCAAGGIEVDMRFFE